MEAKKHRSYGGQIHKQTTQTNKQTKQHNPRARLPALSASECDEGASGWQNIQGRERGRALGEGVVLFVGVGVFLFPAAQFGQMLKFFTTVFL